MLLFDLLKKDKLGNAERERIKQSSRDLLAAVKARLAELDRFWEKEQTKADLKVFILDEIFSSLPTPPFSVGGKGGSCQRGLQPYLAAGGEWRIWDGGVMSGARRGQSRECRSGVTQ